MNIQFYLLLALAIVFNALANIVLKWAMRGQAGVNETGASIIKGLLTNYWAWGGIALFGLAFVLYSVVLTKINLSIAYPVMTSMGLVIISIVSVLTFKEVITSWQLVGLVLIIAGVWLVSAAK
ncbi:MAG: DMT family transporter [Ignavibacteriales bacterium]